MKRLFLSLSVITLCFTLSGCASEINPEEEPTYKEPRFEMCSANDELEDLFINDKKVLSCVNNTKWYDVKNDLGETGAYVVVYEVPGEMHPWIQFENFLLEAFNRKGEPIYNFKDHLAGKEAFHFEFEETEEFGLYIDSFDYYGCSSHNNGDEEFGYREKFTYKDGEFVKELNNKTTLNDFKNEYCS